jgi:hypothetical protein
MFKYLIISLLAALFSVANLSAQKNGKPNGKPAERKENFKSMTPTQRAEAATKRMTKRYKLTADQTTKVQAENSSFTNKIATLQSLRQTNKEQFRTERKAARENHRTGLKSIFDDKQDALFDADLAARKTRQDARRTAKGKAPKVKKGEDATIFESLEDDEDEE